MTQSSNAHGYDDDHTVTYALRGGVSWVALAMSRAMLEEGRRHGDLMLDRLLAVQADLTKLRKDWKDRRPDDATE